MEGTAPRRRALLGVIVAAVTMALVGALPGTAPAQAQAQTQAQTQPGPARPDDQTLERQLRDDTGGGARLGRHAATGRVSFVGTTRDKPVRRNVASSASPEQAARDFFGRYGPLFGVDDQARQLAVSRVDGRDRGGSTVRFQQLHDDVPVMGGDLIVNLDGDKRVLSADGEALPDPNVDVTPGIDAAEAQQRAVAAIAKDRQVPAEQLAASLPELWIYNPALLGGPERPVSAAVWRTEVTSQASGDMRELVLVHAQTGAVVLHFDQNPDAKVLNVCDRNNVAGASETCGSPYTRANGAAPSGIGDVDLAYDYSGIVYDFYMSKFGRDSLDGAGMPLNSTVRYCPDSSRCPFQNAFWNGSQMVYGAGYASADDVVGHELTHGLTDHTSNLYYYYQSGAINESLSDVFGELIDLTDGRGNDAASVRWLVGEDLGIGAIRNMANPAAFGDPDSMTSANYSTDTSDHGGVHTNSGVNNRAAALMVDGGTLNGVTVTGLGTDKVARFYYEVETHLITSAADYNDLFNVLPQACTNLVGTNSITAADCTQVRNAVTATQMNLNAPGEAATREAPVCDAGATPTDVFFDNLENTASGNWAKTTTTGPGWNYPQNPNNAGIDATYATSGTTNFWADDPDASADYSIARTAPVVPAAGTTTYLRFNHSFDFEPGFDGGVVEYSTNGGTSWLDAGGLMVNNGYTGQIGSLGGTRDAFTGASGGYGSSRLNLSTLAGQNVLFRFRIGADSSVGSEGWFIDDVRVYTCGGSVPSLSVSNVNVTEGNSGPTTATFSIIRSGPTAGTSTVQYATADGTATAGSDYVAIPLTTATFAAGQTTAAVAVTVNGDTTSESNETFSLQLSSPTGATIGGTSGTATIVDDDSSAATLAVNDISLPEGNTAPSPATFTITRSGATAGTTTVNYATANGTATAGTDYVAVPSTVASFAPGETTKTVAVSVNGDIVGEPNETFDLRLSSPKGGTIADASGTAAILNDDNPTYLSVNDATVTEGNSGTSTVTYTVTRSGNTAVPSSVTYATANGTATAGSDYVAVPGTTMSFAAGETNKTVVVTVNGDNVDEPNETVLLKLSSPVAAGISDDTGTATIVDDDAATYLSVNDVSVTEGNSGTTPATFTITRSGNTAGATSATYSTANATATAGSDYTAIPATTVTFAAGQTSKTVTVSVLAGTVGEPTETFTLNLSAPVGATLSDASGTATISDDDAPTYLAVKDVSLTEGNSGTTPATFAIVRSGNTAGTTSVSYTTANGSATGGSDYTALAPTTLTFAAGETSKTVTVAVTGDIVDEADETFMLRISAPVGAALSDDTGTATIVDDDAAAYLAVGDVSVTEGNSGTTPATFTLTRTGSTAGASTVTYATASGTATAGGDYTAVPATTLTFAAGETSKTVTVTVNGDIADEPDETFSLRLSSPVGATISDDTAVATIADDDAPTYVTINDATVTEGNAGTATATFTVARAGNTAGTSSVTYATANGTASAGSDYTAVAPTVLTFAAGETSKTVSVSVTGDTTSEPDETFLVKLSAPTAASIADDTGTGAVLDDDGASYLAVNDLSVTEGNSGPATATFTVTRSGSTGGTSAVTYATAAGTATAGTDYTAVAATPLNFAAGETSKAVGVSVTGDTVEEANETLLLRLSSPAGATISDDTGTATIVDDDGAVTAGPATFLAVQDVAVTEGNTGTTTAAFTITRSGTTTGNSSVTYATANGTATAGTDYTALGSTTVTFAAGETSKPVSVTVIGDTVDEPAETVLLKLSSPSGAVISDDTGTGTILDDDAPTTLAVNDLTVTEGNSGPTSATFTVTRSGSTAGSSSVTYATANGSATAGSDYTAVGATVLSFAAGETSKPVSVTVTGDTIDEPAETFLLKLSAPTAATISDDTGTATITDDDAVTSFSVNDVAVPEGDTGTSSASFTVTRSGATTGTSSVTYATATGTATAGTDYAAVAATTLSFVAGETSKAVSVPVTGDTVDEPNETFNLKLSAPVGATLSDDTGTATILDDDEPIYVAVDDVAVTEGNSGTATASFTVTRSGNTAVGSSVKWATANGTALAGSDYTAVAATSLTFAAGETSKPLSVVVTSDAVLEPDETFVVKLSAPVGATISDDTGTATVLNDDAPTFLAVDDLSITEGNSGTTAATFTITRSGSTTGVSSVTYATANGSASAGSDYTAVPATTVTFAAGETSKTVSVTVTGDTAVEASETFLVKLTSAVGAFVSDDTGTGTITDDDGTTTSGPATFLSVDDVAVTEGNSGSATATLTVTRSGDTAGTSSVSYVTANGTATAGSDYTAVVATTLNFAAGETSKTVSVAVTGDTVDEPDETVLVKLSSPVGATISDDTGTAMIVDDDAPTYLSVNDVTINEGNSGTTTFTFTVTRSGATAGTSSVTYATANGSATAGSDYTALPATTLNFAAGETSKTVSVSVIGETVVEPDQTFSLKLSSPVRATISDDTGTGTIRNDD